MLNCAFHAYGEGSCIDRHTEDHPRREQRRKGRAARPATTLASSTSVMRSALVCAPTAGQGGTPRRQVATGSVGQSAYRIPKGRGDGAGRHRLLEVVQNAAVVPEDMVAARVEHIPELFAVGANIVRDAPSIVRLVGGGHA